MRGETGNPVRIGSGPAAVNGDESRRAPIMAQSLVKAEAGAGKAVARRTNRSQKTCLTSGFLPRGPGRHAPGKFYPDSHMDGEFGFFYGLFEGGRQSQAANGPAAKTFESVGIMGHGDEERGPMDPGLLMLEEGQSISRLRAFCPRREAREIRARTRRCYRGRKRSTPASA